MSKTLGTNQATRITGTDLYPVILLDLLFDSPNQVFLWTGFEDLTYDGKLYLPVGGFLTVSDIEETADIAAKSLTLTLSGLDSDILSLALQEPYQGRICEISMAFVTGAGAAPAAGEASVMFSGLMDVMSIDEQAESSTVTLTVENRLVTLEKPRTARFTNAFQQDRYPGDIGLEFIEDMQDRVTLWGKTEVD